jgi:hypothetical protein
MGKKEIASHVIEIVIGLILLSLLFLLHSHGLKCWTGWVGLVGLVPLWYGIAGFCSGPKACNLPKADDTKPESK